MNLDQVMVLKRGWKPYFNSTSFSSPCPGNDGIDDIINKVIEDGGNR